MTNEAYDNSTILDPRIAERLKRDDKGLVAAVIQQFDTKEVLMVGYMNDEAIRRTLMTGRVTFWSRSRQEYWRKGDTSGHAQYVKSFALDCDGDAILVEVDQVGAACHTGKRSCFEEGGQLPVVVGYRTKEQEGQRGVNAAYMHSSGARRGRVANNSTNWLIRDIV